MELRDLYRQGSSLRRGDVLEVLSAIGVRLRALPAGIWLALGAAASILVLFLRGRRLEAELGRAKLALEAARAHVELNKGKAKAVQHYTRSMRHAENVRALEKTRTFIKDQASDTQKTLSALPPSKVHDAYEALAKKRWKSR